MIKNDFQIKKLFIDKKNVKYIINSESYIKNKGKQFNYKGN